MKLPPHLLHIHRQWGCAALCVSGTREVIPRKLGDNRGGRPIKLHISQNWDDTITPVLNGASPYHWQGLLYRVWFEGRPWARKMEEMVLDILEHDDFEVDQNERLRMAHIDIGPDHDPKKIYDLIRFKSAIEGIAAWTDEAHIAELANRYQQRMTRIAEGVT